MWSESTACVEDWGSAPKALGYSPRRTRHPTNSGCFAGHQPAPPHPMANSVLHRWRTSDGSASEYVEIAPLVWLASNASPGIFARGTFVRSESCSRPEGHGVCREARGEGRDTAAFSTICWRLIRWRSSSSAAAGRTRRIRSRRERGARREDS